MLGRIYRRLYIKFGGKPWSEITRDEQRKYPLAFMVLFLICGVVVGCCRHHWQLLVAFLLGILAGHLWF